jgi:hypothetical protein
MKNSRLLISLMGFLLAGGICLADPLPVQPQALDFCGIRVLQDGEPNLIGRGVVVAAVCRSATYENGLPQDDYRFNMTHQAFAGGDIVFADGSTGLAGVSAHSTAIGGILVGYDPAAGSPRLGSFLYKGACPGVSLDVYEFWRFLTLTLFEGKPLNAEVLTMSLGDVFEEWWTRGIERLVEEQGVFAVASAGNGSDARDPVLYPAAGANVLAVGVLDAEYLSEVQFSLDSFTLPRPDHSSVGPTADHRAKPDLVAPGRCVVPAAYSPMGYEVRGDYSSLAAPIAAGAVTLLLEEAHRNPDLSPYFGRPGANCLLKAILCTSARKLPWWHKGQPALEDDNTAVLDYRQGAGMLDAQAAYTLLTTDRQITGSAGWDLSELAPGHRLVYPVRVDLSADRLTATLVWNRHYEARYPFRALYDQDRDLRLELWTAEPGSNQPGLLLDYSDSAIDNMEHLYTRIDPNTADYLLVVRFSDLDGSPYDRPELFAVAWNAGPDPSAGSRWWYDLNDDGAVNFHDQFLQKMLDEQLFDPEGLEKVKELLRVSDERLDLLIRKWSRWRNYLTRWEDVLQTPSATAISQIPE